MDRDIQDHSFDRAVVHANRVARIVGGGTVEAGIVGENAMTAVAKSDHVAYPVESWRRCLEDFKLDPLAPVNIVPYIGVAKLNQAREALGADLSFASDELNDLFVAVREIGYSASLADPDGLFVLEQADRHAATYVATDQPGWIWSEKFGGTNSVGTCIAEGKLTSVFGRQHFYSECMDTACAGAPVFDARGSLWGVLSITSRNSALQMQTHLLATHVVAQTAARLSSRIFRRSFAKSTLIEWRTDDGAFAMIAVNADQRIEGANRVARRALGLTDAREVSKSLWSLFDTNAGLRKAKLEGGQLELRATRDHRVLHVNVTPATQPATSRFAGTPGPGAARPKAMLPTFASPNLASPDFVTIAECAGDDPLMLRNVDILRRVRNAGLPTLLLGETGTGKDTLARAIHVDSDRAEKPFVAFNCAAVPESLIDSELFGYVPGTFTGANTKGNKGRILEADGGTLFLDEIGDMPLMLQTRLLRVLETREVVALGTGVAQKVDIYVVAATNQDLQTRVAQGLFRQDLYYRIAGAIIQVPALRDRADVASIIDNILARVSNNGKQLDQAARNALMQHTWPGNIRELAHVLRRAASIAYDTVITVDDLMIGTAMPPRLGNTPIVAPTIAATPFVAPSFAAPSPGDTGFAAVAHAEASAIRSALQRSGGDVLEAAKYLGLSRATLYRKIQRHNLQRPA